MAQLRRDYHLFDQRQTEIVILGPDGQQAFKRHWEQECMPMIGLSDAHSKVADSFLQEVNLFKLGRMPAQFLINPAGIICYAHYGKSMSDIPDNQTVLNILDQLQAEA